MFYYQISGLSIVGVHINNVSHEFSTIPGLKEDIIEVLLNLKQIVLKGDLIEPINARLVYFKVLELLLHKT